MLFAFRGTRTFQVLSSLAALATGVGSVMLLKRASDGSLFAFIPAVLLGVAFLFLFGITLRIPTAFVAISEDRTRVRFPGFLDTVIPTSDIVGSRLVKHHFLGGLGARTTFDGSVALATAWGEAAELILRQPVRVWVIPKILPVRATRLVLTVRNPQKLVDRFSGRPPLAGPSPTAPPARKMKPRRTR